MRQPDQGGCSWTEWMQVHDVTEDDPQPALVSDVTGKAATIREALRKIGSSLYKLDDLMNCLRSCSSVLAEKRKTLDERRQHVQDLYQSKRGTDDSCLDNLPGLMDAFDEKLGVSHHLLKKEMEAIGRKSDLLLGTLESLNTAAATVEEVVAAVLQDPGHADVVTAMNNVCESDGTIGEMLRPLQRGLHSGSGGGKIFNFFPAGSSSGARTTRSSTGAIPKKRNSYAEDEEDAQFESDVEVRITKKTNTGSSNSRARSEDTESSDYWMDFSGVTTQKKDESDEYWSKLPPAAFLNRSTNMKSWVPDSSLAPGAATLTRDQQLSRYNELAELGQDSISDPDSDFRPETGQLSDGTESAAEQVAPRASRSASKRVVRTQEETEEVEAVPRPRGVGEVVDMCSTMSSPQLSPQPSAVRAPMQAVDLRAPLRRAGEPGLGGFLLREEDSASADVEAYKELEREREEAGRWEAQHIGSGGGTGLFGNASPALRRVPVERPTYVSSSGGDSLRHPLQESAEKYFSSSAGVEHTNSAHKAKSQQDRPQAEDQNRDFSRRRESGESAEEAALRSPEAMRATVAHLLGKTRDKIVASPLPQRAEPPAQVLQRQGSGTQSDSDTTSSSDINCSSNDYQSALDAEEIDTEMRSTKLAGEAQQKMELPFSAPVDLPFNGKGPGGRSAATKASTEVRGNEANSAMSLDKYRYAQEGEADSGAAQSQDAPWLTSGVKRKRAGDGEDPHEDFSSPRGGRVSTKLQASAVFPANGSAMKSAKAVAPSEAVAEGTTALAPTGRAKMRNTAPQMQQNQRSKPEATVVDLTGQV